MLSIARIAKRISSAKEAATALAVGGLGAEHLGLTHNLVDAFPWLEVAAFTLTVASYGIVAMAALVAMYRCRQGLFSWVKRVLYEFKRILRD